MIKRRIAAAAMAKYGSERKAAKALGISRGQLRSALGKRSFEEGKARKKQTALSEYTPKSGYKNNGKGRSFVITCAQNNTPVDKLFLKTLKHFCKANEAQLLVIPMRYKNPTGFSPEDQKEPTIEWDAELFDNLLTWDMDLGEHLRVMGKFQIQATASRPLSGLEAVAKEKSAIFGHPNLEWRTVPTAHDRMPRILQLGP